MIWSFVSPGAWISSSEMPARLTVNRSEKTFCKDCQKIIEISGKKEEVLLDPQQMCQQLEMYRHSKKSSSPGSGNLGRVDIRGCGGSVKAQI